ncbi:MAG: hypothetical protein WC632_04990 [Candidatus Margulisiibacteriota bacterium]
MAHKKSTALILGLALTGLAACAALAASQADIKKFPPVSGEIYGQASPSVRSITVNGKPVSFDSGQNFKAAVNLRPGEKYLVLKINYEGLRIIKKYLILRKTAIKKFKVFVPKEKIEKDVQASKRARAAELKTQRGEQARQRALQALAKQERARVLQAERENNWLKKVPSPKFYAKEFRGSNEVLALNQAVVGDNYGLPFKTPIDSVTRLNELLKVTNFYELGRKKHPNAPLSPQARALVEETAAYRGRPFEQLSPYQQKKVLLLNRLLLEAFYPSVPQRDTWWVATPKTKEEAKWLKAVPSPKYYASEFTGGTAEVAALNELIARDNYGLPFRAPLDSVDRLNELLQTPNFYELTQKKNKVFVPSPLLAALIKETADYRNLPFWKLDPVRQKKIRLLNRLLLSTLYPEAPQRAAWGITAAEMPLPKVKEYLYVWEFSEGKLLIAKETKGKYSAEVYLPVSQEWLDLRGISEAELRQLIEKPVKTFKPKKK